MPEWVAEDLLALDCVAQDKAITQGLKTMSGRRSRRTSMAPDWFQPVGLDRQIAKAHELFADHIGAHAGHPAIISPEERDPARLKAFIAFLCETILKQPGSVPFKQGRLNRAQRAELGLDMGNHAYNKRFRFLNRMHGHLVTYQKETRLASYRLLGKVGLLKDLGLDEFAADPWSAAFVSYHAARKRRRSVFTNTSQDRAFDKLGEALLQRALAGHPNLKLIARVFPDPRVTKRLAKADAGLLLGYWTLAMREMAGDLESTWEASSFDLDEMIVQRGDDSSTWNVTAQAWNAARDGWMALAYSLDMQVMIDRLLPGKCMRLMAADVAAWHRMSGGGIHPDTRVWRALPRPWDVLTGRAQCDRSLVERVCKREGVDPYKSGWAGPRPTRRAVDTRPTPELVHGVEVASPEVAALFRRMGVFSGKP